MAIPNIFTRPVLDELVTRMDKLTPESRPVWGKMSVGQMLAHCNVTYEMLFDNKHPKPGFFMRFILKTLVKGKVVGEAQYKQGSPTAPAFIIKETRDVATERERLKAYLNRVAEMGEKAFEGKESLSFGPLSTKEWNNMFWKHLDHHFRQFGV